MMMRDIICLLPFLTICCSSLGELGLLVFAVQMKHMLAQARPCMRMALFCNYISFRTAATTHNYVMWLYMVCRMDTVVRHIFFSSS